MKAPTPLTTERLLLRRWRSTDLEPFAAMNADPRVMEHFPSPLDRASSDARVKGVETAFAAEGLGLWALERRDTGAFIGFAGLAVPGFAAPFMPAVEVGWRLAFSAWGHGYASEAARAALADGFGRVGHVEVVSFTAATNTRSEALMRRLGMTHDPVDDFDHPGLPVGHRLRRHLLYRVRPAA